MKKNEVLNSIRGSGIVPVIRAKTAEKAKKITEAVKEGGINIIEITMTVPGAVDVIDDLTELYSDDPKVIFGAGSVMDGKTALNCIQAGAEFIVGPALDLEMIEVANRYQKPVIPGAMTPTEVKKAMEAGADVVKIFPAGLFGPKIIKSIKGPMPQAELLPTGGVSHDNVQDWIEAGSFAVAAGSAIVDGAEEGNFDQVKENAEKFVELIEEAKNN